MSKKVLTADEVSKLIDKADVDSEFGDYAHNTIIAACFMTSDGELNLHEVVNLMEKINKIVKLYNAIKLTVAGQCAVAVSDDDKFEIRIPNNTAKFKKQLDDYSSFSLPFIKARNARFN